MENDENIMFAEEKDQHLNQPLNNNLQENQMYEEIDEEGENEMDENDQEQLTEEERIFMEILETNQKRKEMEELGEYIKAGGLKEYLLELGKLYEKRCIINMEQRHR